MDAANDLALLKAGGAVRGVAGGGESRGEVGGTVATVGFPNIGLQGFAPNS